MEGQKIYVCGRWLKDNTSCTNPACPYPHENDATKRECYFFAQYGQCNPQKFDCTGLRHVVGEMNDPARRVGISNVVSPFPRTGAQLHAAVDAIRIIKSGEARGPVVVLRDIPIEDLVPGPAHLNTWQLRDGSNTAVVCRFVGLSCGIVPSTAQRKVDGSFDAEGRRLPANHDLVVFIETDPAAPVESCLARSAGETTQ